MKLSVNKEQIIEGLQKAAAIIPAKAGAAYLRSIWLKAEQGSLSIMATDANIEFTGRYPAEVKQPGLIGVQGRAFVDLVRQLPAGVLQLTLDEGTGNLLLEQGRRTYKLPVSGAEWFQNFSEFPAETPVTWSGDFLQDVLDRVVFCISDDDATDAIDLKYARQTADYLGSEHHEVIINREMVLQSLEEVIRLLGTWDITTIRASMGMYLLCKAIHEQTDVRVLLTGEISDELFGYKYTDYAPTADAFQQESQKRIRELSMYDVLRADRCISSNSIEARVPFGDLDFVRYVMAIDPEKKLNSYGKGKSLLRKAFEGDWLPPEILWREKAAFSDAVGHSMVDDIKEYTESLYTDEEFQLRRANYSAHCMPFTKESLFYREIFEKYYHDQSRTIVGFWMPNKAWPGCNVNDPSARVLANYGASGV